MTKISEYPIITNPTEDDILIGTDVNSSDVTKNFSIGSIIDLIGDINQGPMGPQGNPGVQGIPGTPGAVGPAGLTWRGTWVSGTSYIANDAVSYNGASWFCILATSGTTTPNLATANWALLASQGAQGIQGVQGATGPMGPQGPTGGVLPYKSIVSYIQFTSDGTSLNTSIYNDFEPGINFAQSSTGVYELTSFLSSFTTKTVIIPFDKISGNPAKVRLPIFNFSPGVIIGYYTIQRWNNNNVRMHFWDTSNNLVNPFTLLGSSNILVDIKIYN